VKLKLFGKARFEESCILIPVVIFGKEILAKRAVRWYKLDLDSDAWNDQKNDPIFLEDLGNLFVWLYRDFVVKVDEKEASIMSPEDIKLHIKHFVLLRENRFSKMQKEVERFEKFEKLKPIYREQIPEEVRMYVWRRDRGMCVVCQSKMNLEFDHIIPISEGGSNTERNIQLLCSDCNKKKSNKI
jgi:hypothetical protein